MALKTYQPNYQGRIGGKNADFFPIRPDIPPRVFPCVLGSDLALSFSKSVAVKSRQLAELRRLLKDYGLPGQKWLQSTTQLTRSRLYWLMAVLFEAGVAHDYCRYYKKGSGWEATLHEFWHEVVK